MKIANGKKSNSWERKKLNKKKQQQQNKADANA